MLFSIRFTDDAIDDLSDLKRRDHRAFNAVENAIKHLAQNPRHPGLHTHKYVDPPGFSVDVWQSYAQNRTPAARRIWWIYGPEQGEITVVRILDHPG
jgi:hypothetical protein